MGFVSVTAAWVVAAAAGAGLSGEEESQALSNASAQARNNPLLNMVALIGNGREGATI
ncbi:hypothetical protein ALP41_01928 [Pseudomonas savastanoi pv. nerii]|nr:hypothetical protein ALP41_01928 [Pseudomonas savastanoi pv. nerii]